MSVFASTDPGAPADVPLPAAARVGVAAAATVLAVLLLLLVQKVRVAPVYPDFIVGSLAWYQGSKLQDLLAPPLAIGAFLGASAWLTHVVRLLNRHQGAAAAMRFGAQLAWWSLPAAAAGGAVLLGAAFDRGLMGLSALGLLTVGLATTVQLKRHEAADPAQASLGLLAGLMLGLWPLALALLLGRGSSSAAAGAWADRLVGIGPRALALGLLIGVALSLLRAGRVHALLRRALPITQLGLPLLLLGLLPARLQAPDGSVLPYPASGALPVVIGLLVLIVVADVLRRARRAAAPATHDPAFASAAAPASASLLPLLSPLALMALLLAFRLGGTLPPLVEADDYHFGERLVGLLAYRHGALPYVDYMPAHGLLEDDLAALLSLLFHDGLASTVPEAGRLAFALLGGLAFLALQRFTGSLALAFAAVALIGVRPAWLMFVIALCLWCGRSLVDRPARWLALWLASVPLLVLAAPPFGLLATLASLPLAGFAAWRFVRSPTPRAWGAPVAVLLAGGVLALATPLPRVLAGAVRYVLENGGINQVAYGIPWAASWNVGAQQGLLFEALRMSWTVVLAACALAAWRGWRAPAGEPQRWLPALLALLLGLLLVPYSMGRIDPGALSRPGHVGGLAWALLLPLALWPRLRPEHRATCALLVAGMAAAVNPAPVASAVLFAGASPRVAAGPVKDGAAAGLPGIGRALVDDAQWARLQRLRRVLDRQLAPGEPYLDLTNRNAQYAYLGRRPPVAVTAPYNMASPAQQQRDVAALERTPPKLALLDGDTVAHDGGGLALRSPLLYRHVMAHYVPRLDEGLIVGDWRGGPLHEPPAQITLTLTDRSDADWQRGVHRQQAALAIAERHLLALLAPGVELQLADGSLHRVRHSCVECGTVTLDGPALEAGRVGAPQTVTLALTPERLPAYRAALFEKAFATPDVGQLPQSWGRSERSLAARMRPVPAPGGLLPRPHQLQPLGDGRYRVSGAQPALEFDLAPLKLAGEDAGLLRLEFRCAARLPHARFHVAWWGDLGTGTDHPAKLAVSAADGVLIVPLDAQPRWLAMQRITGLRLEFAGAAGCGEVVVRGLSLHQRAGEP